MAKAQRIKSNVAFKTTVQKRHSLYERINRLKDVFSEKAWLIIFMSVSMILAGINFNAHISEAHDDAMYLEAAVKFVREFPNYFYTANAPFYPMFLAIVYYFIGFKLIVFKLINVVFQMLAVYFFFKTFYHRLPWMVFLPSMFFVSANHLMLYFASMTFTESMFMCLQFAFFYVFAKQIEGLQNGLFRPGYSFWLSMGLLLLLLSITRSAAIVAVPSVLVFFWWILNNKKWAIYSLSAFLICYIPYNLAIKIIWKGKNQFANQSKILLQKDPYDASLGNEDIVGFFQRFIDNSELYLSKRFFQILGLKDEQSTTTNGLLAFLMWFFLIWGFWWAYKHKKYLISFIGIYTIALLVLSFFILQARWDQPRIVLVAMPAMLIIYFSWIENYFKSRFLRWIQSLIIIVVIVSMFISSIKRGIHNLPILIKNINGDIYYGYTPDWQNFLRASAWCADSLPPHAYVASRKAPMSFVYGKGKKFFPIYSVIKKDPQTNQSNPDSALAFFQQNGVTHILLPHLRIDPTKNTGQYINTIHNILEPIQAKYPNALKLVHTEGETEPCYVFEFVYNQKK